MSDTDRLNEALKTIIILSKREADLKAENTHLRDNQERYSERMCQIANVAKKDRDDNARLRAALIAHRADMHHPSKRPCQTCKDSAVALGIDAKVPNSCADRHADKQALEA